MNHKTFGTGWLRTAFLLTCTVSLGACAPAQPQRPKRELKLVEVPHATRPRSYIYRSADSPTPAGQQVITGVSQ